MKNKYLIVFKDGSVTVSNDMPSPSDWDGLVKHVIRFEDQMEYDAYNDVWTEL